MTDALTRRQLLNLATEPYQTQHGGSRFAYYFARGKLARDPIFFYLLQHFSFPEGAHLLDLGSGQSLLPCLLEAATKQRAMGTYPASWQVPPATFTYLGYDLMPRDVTRANRALAHLRNHAHAEIGDMCSAVLPPSDICVILDVLHYVPIAAQNELLQRIARALAPKGTLLLRVGDAHGGLGFHFSQWVDRCVTRIRGHQVAPVYVRSLADWTSHLQTLGFTVQTQAMSRGTGFANVLLIASLAPHD